MVRPSVQEADFKLLSDLLTERFGLVFEGVRGAYLRTRVAPRMRELHLDTYLDYYHYLISHPKREEEFDLLRERVTNNETYFFRETHQFQCLIQQVIPQIEDKLRKRPLRILSAGCSSGEEPYTLVMQLLEAGLQARGIDWQIDAVDLNPLRIQQAQGAIYEQSSLRACDQEARGKYFHNRDGRFELKENYRNGVIFREANLVDDSAGYGWGPYDVIFCRNVLIYVSEEAFHRIISLFHRLLMPHGTLFLGHSESLIGRRDDFTPAIVDDAVVYRPQVK